MEKNEYKGSAISSRKTFRNWSKALKQSDEKDRRLINLWEICRRHRYISTEKNIGTRSSYYRVDYGPVYKASQRDASNPSSGCQARTFSTTRTHIRRYLQTICRRLGYESFSQGRKRFLALAFPPGARVSIFFFFFFAMPIKVGKFYDRIPREERK